MNGTVRVLFKTRLIFPRINGPIVSGDPDLQIRGRPGHPEPEITGEGRGIKKKFFRPFGPQFGLKIRGAGPPGPQPWICH